MEKGAGLMQAVIVTTAHRGVFFGYLPNGDDPAAKTLRLERVRMCIYWPPENHGVMGLATTGPLQDAKIGPAATSMLLHDITAVMWPTAVAVKRWEAEPWS